MIATEQSLIFSLHGALYAISAAMVSEICWLPELRSLATASPDMIGMFDWRSQPIPVMHLDLRFGQSFDGCNLTDRAIVVKYQDTHMAIIAHDVLDVQFLNPEPLDPDLSQVDRQLPADRQFVSGIARLNDAPVICLDLDRLLGDRDIETVATANATDDFYQRCCVDITPTNRQIFAARARQLQTPIAPTQSEAVSGVLGVQIGQSYLGIPLELVVDVDVLDRFVLTPVPLAPNHILGQTDWRGKILPILEIGWVCQISVFPRQEFVVVKVDEIAIGIAVDRIFDVSYLTASEIDAVPTSDTSQLRSYLHGVTNYADGLMYLLQLEELIKQEFLLTSVAT